MIFGVPLLMLITVAAAEAAGPPPFCPAPPPTCRIFPGRYITAVEVAIVLPPGKVPASLTDPLPDGSSQYIFLPAIPKSRPSGATHERGYHQLLLVSLPQTAALVAPVRASHEPSARRISGVVTPEPANPLTEPPWTTISPDGRTLAVGYQRGYCMDSVGLIFPAASEYKVAPGLPALPGPELSPPMVRT